MIPSFPNFKEIQLQDREFIHPTLWEYQPQTSEFTFTNLYIWRSHYGLVWSRYKDWLILMCNNNAEEPYFFQPIGPASRNEVVLEMFEWISQEKGIAQPRIERADSTLVSELAGTEHFSIAPTRDQFDYVYRSSDLIKLPGNKYHARRNHINKFRNSHTYSIETLNDARVRASMEFIERWCGMRRCEEDMNLLDEWDAVSEVLAHYTELEIICSVLFVNDKVEAFAVGELLNKNTAVIHIEKANPEIKELYAVINQQFVQRAFGSVPFINREQDLGVEGLRKAKLSYHPEHMVEKYLIRFSKIKRKTNTSG